MKDLIAPLTGVAFLVLGIVTFIVGGEPPGADDPLPKIVNYYLDNKDAIQISAILGAVAAAFLVFFAAYLRKVLRAVAGPDSILPGVVLVGASIMAVGIAIDGTIYFATAEAANDVEPITVQTLQALWDNDFVPIALGSILFLISAGISIVQTGALPKWLGWVAILLALTGPTPAGFVAFLGGAIWILIVSVLLAVRARRATPAAAV